MRHLITIAIVTFVASFPTVAIAQVAYPPKPATYHIDLRYKIASDRDARVKEYRALRQSLSAAGFVEDPREDADLDQFDPNAERLSGTIPSNAVDKLLSLAAIRTILLRPTDRELGDDPLKPIQIRLTLSSGLQPEQQQLFHDQTIAALRRLGFVEMVGYDHRRFSIARGSIPAGRVTNLLRDLRDQPSGWFFTDIPRDLLNLPFRDILPLRAIELLPDVDFGPVVAPVQPAPQMPVSPKFTADMRVFLSDPANIGKPCRVELVVAKPIVDYGRKLRDWLQIYVPNAGVEGVIGHFVTLRLSAPKDLDAILTLPEIVAIRTPRTAVELEANIEAIATPTAIAKSNIGALHAMGYRGTGRRVVVIASDYAGTPAKYTSSLIDLTSEVSADILPAPATKATTGTQAVAAVAMAAPAATIQLVRVDPSAAHQLLTVGRAILGDATASAALQTRGDELLAENDVLTVRRVKVQEEYRQAFNDLSDEVKPANRRKAAQAAIQQLQAAETAFKAKSDRLLKLRSQLVALKGADVVVNTLVWEDGYAHDGLSELSQLLDNATAAKTLVRTRSRTPVALPTWVQMGSSSIGSVWAGSYVDADHNDVIEFVTNDTPIPAEAWSRELNGLDFVSPTGTKSSTLKQTQSFRITMQWREPRASETETSSAAYLPFVLRLLRQIDPTGQKTASDDLVEVARSTDAPVLIQRTLNASVYEQTLQVVLPADGRYFLRVDGRTALDVLTRTARRTVELQPRISVTPTGTTEGRFVFSQFVPTNAGVGIPADAVNALTVSRPGGLTGAGPGIKLRTKPEVIVDDVPTVASAAGTVAGAVACLSEAGVQGKIVTRYLTSQLGGSLRLSAEWFAPANR